MVFIYGQLLRVNFARNSAVDEDEEKKAENEGIDTFGILPCRPAEVTETIQKEINAMFPTYSLQIEVRQFVTGIGDAANMVEEYGELRGNVESAENEANGLKVKMEEGSADENEKNRYNQVIICKDAMMACLALLSF